MAASIALIIVLGLTADLLFRKFKLPGLVGMLIAGVLIGPNVLDLISPDMMEVSGDFRKIALVVILLRAGFELNRDTLHRVGRAALIMSCLPAIFEIVAVVLVAPVLLDISYTEAAILGSILAAVSPAVVVPLMINFIDRGRGAKKGIPTLILGASAVDDVFVIVLFTIFMDMYGPGDISIWSHLADIPVSIGLGTVAGLIAGYILYRLFTRFDWRPPKRTLVVLGVSIGLVWLESRVDEWVPVASLLGVMAIGFIILEKSKPIAHLISQELKKLWIAAELLLFVLVGAQVDIDVAWDAGLAGTAIIFIGLTARSAGTWISLLGTNLNQKEKLFSVVAYIPKATVQAAIGAVPLAAGVGAGEEILAVAVLSILITAPIGAIGIMVMGERILDHGDEDRSLYSFKQLRESLALPHVGQHVRNKKDDSRWKVIEEKEMWIDSPGYSHQLPAIEIRFWYDESDASPGQGRAIYCSYHQAATSFNDQWEILYNW